MKAEGGVAIALNEFDKHPSTFLGHKGKEIKILHGTNESAVIDGILYSGHALDRMQQRGFTPSVVKHIIETGERSLAKHGRVKIYSHENNMSIILEGNKIVTIRFSK